MTISLAYCLVFLTIVFTVFGQLIIKVKAGSMPPLPGDWPARLNYLLELFLSPYILIGVAAGGVAAVCWILAMTKLPIGVAYPFVALTFPMIVIASYFLFGEQLTTLRLVGVVLICGGVMLVNQSA